MSRYAMCPECGHRMRRVRDIFGDWDGETYTCDYCDSDYDDDDDIPEGCAACGGDWPNCTTSCPMYDD